MRNELQMYSLATVRIDCCCGPDDERISRATGFFLMHRKKLFLVTNDHVVSGLGHGDRRVLSESGAIPQNLIIKWGTPKKKPKKANEFSNLFDTFLKIPLYKDPDCYSEPIWFSHPELGYKVDVVALDLTEIIEGQKKYKEEDKLLPVSLNFQENPVKCKPMQRVFIVGYPLDEDKSPNKFPIYKSGSIASEPDFLGERPYFLVDGKTKSGMSGSPVIIEHPPTIEQRNGQLEFVTGATELVGVYSGRESEAGSTFEAELGIVWPYKEAVLPVLDSAIDTPA